MLAQRPQGVPHALPQVLLVHLLAHVQLQGLGRHLKTIDCIRNKIFSRRPEDEQPYILVREQPTVPTGFLQLNLTYSWRIIGENRGFGTQGGVSPAPCPCPLCGPS